MKNPWIWIIVGGAILYFITKQNQKKKIEQISMQSGQASQAFVNL